MRPHSAMAAAQWMKSFPALKLRILAPCFDIVKPPFPSRGPLEAVKQRLPGAARMAKRLQAIGLFSARGREPAVNERRGRCQGISGRKWGYGKHETSPI